MSACSRWPAPRSARRGHNAGTRWRAAGLALALLCGSSALAIAAENAPLAEAGRLEAAGDRAGAARAYRDWLTANPDDPQADSVFFSLFRVETSLPELLELSSLPKLGAGPLLALAGLAEISGRVEEARSLYARAVEAGAGAEGLVGFLALSLAMNDESSIQKGLQPLRAADPVWAGIIEGMSDLASGRLDPAAEKLSRAASSAADPRAALAALWGLVECAARGGNPAAVSVARAELDRRFPGSPEQAVAAGLLARLARPAQFAVQPGAEHEPEPQPRPVPPAQPSGGARFAVQAGSFLVRENADYLAADLARKGFAPLVRDEQRDGKQLFRVLAGSGLERGPAEELIQKLVKAGFDGFLISEAR